MQVSGGQRVSFQFACLMACYLAATSCPAKDDTESESAKKLKPFVRQKKIVLEKCEPDVPEAQGRRTFLVRCTVCHSARYTTMQPDFPEKVWEKTVEKMIKNYGAHINPAEAREIVAYLVSIKGKKSVTGK